MSARTYAVATGESEKTSARATAAHRFTWPDLLDWLDLENPADAKDCGWHVLGELDGQRRAKDAVLSRSALALDADHARPGLHDALQALGCAAVAHTTWSHGTTERDRYRVVVPLSRDVSAVEYRLIAGALLADLGAEQFDRGSLQPERLMHRPSRQGRDYRSHVFEGDPLDADTWLQRAAALGLVAPHRPTTEHCDCAQAAETHPWAAAAVRAELQRLDDLPHPWHEGAYWDETTFAVACNLREIANTPCCGYTLEAAEADLFDRAPADEAWGAAEHRAKWLTAEARVGDQQRPCRRGAEFDVVPPSTPAPVSTVAGQASGGAPLAVQLRQQVEALYDVFPAGNDSRIFAQPKAGGRAELLTGPFVIRAAQGLGSRAGTLSAAATEAAKVLTAEAETAPTRALSMRAHQGRDRLVLDLAQPGNSRCVVMTATGWTVEDVPPADVVFQSVGRALPDPERGGSVEELRTLLRWGEDDPRWPLVKGWLPSALLADRPRPLLGFFGPQGSAKSTTGRFVIGVLDPKPAGALGSGFGKNRADDETKALSSYLVAWDNVSALSGEGADLLSRLVTGDMIEKRRLYTDAEVATIVYRRTGVVTGISVPRGVKADTLDRLILIPLAALTERLSEDTLEAEWTRVHPRVLAGVCDLAVAALAGERKNPERLRMADYAENLWAIDPALYRAYAENVRDSRSEMASNDPFLLALVDWLEHEPQNTCESTASDLRERADPHRDLDAWWPRNGKAFMDAVTANVELLNEVGVTVTERRAHGVRLKRFTLVRDLL